MSTPMERAKQLKLMAFDVDGVLTDGSLYFTPGGDEIKVFSSLDGHGLKMLQSCGVRLSIITGRKSPMVEKRAANLGITLLHQGVEDKRAVLQEMLATLGIAPQEAGYMGDDVVDLPILRACGFAATVADGHEFVRRHVHWVSRCGGGRGAVRELCDFILRAQGHYDRLMHGYLA